jgi:hypothetical protein
VRVRVRVYWKWVWGEEGRKGRRACPNLNQNQKREKD